EKPGIGEWLHFQKGDEMQQVEAVSREGIWRAPTGAQMPHEARDNGNGEIVVIKEFKRNITFVVELNTVDSHSSLAPSVVMGHLFLTRTNALQGSSVYLTAPSQEKQKSARLVFPSWKQEPNKPSSSL